MTCVSSEVKFLDQRPQVLLNTVKESWGRLLETGTFGQPDTASYNSSSPYSKCVKDYQRLEAFWSLVGVIAVLLLAFLLYWIEPWRKIRRENLQPFSADDAPDAWRALAEVLKEAGLKHTPTFVWKPLDLSSSGLAFGRIGKYYVSLTGGLVCRYSEDPAGFCAILRHELAHLKNSDIDKTYFALATWQSFVVLGLIPFFIDLLFWGLDPFRHRVFLAMSFLTVAALTALVFLFRNSLLRTRETYADVRASIWDGPNGTLMQMVRQLPSPPRSFWKRLFQVHPDPAIRVQCIRDTSRLMMIDFWTVFGTGLAATIAYSGVDDFFAHILPGEVDFRSPLLSASFFALMISAFIGLIIWRNTFTNRILKSSPPRDWLLSLGLTLGLALGQFVSFDASINYLSLVSLPTHVLSLIEKILTPISFMVWLLLFWLFIHLILKWLSETAAIWVKTIRSRSGLWVIIVSSLLIFGGTLAYFMSWFMQAQTISYTFGWPVAALTLLIYMADGFLINITLLIPFSLVVFPFLTSVFQRRDLSIPGWAYLDKDNIPQVSEEPAATRPALAAWIGLSAGILYTVLILLIRVILRLGLSESARSTDLIKLALAWGMIFLAGVIQALAGLIMSGRTRHLQMEHAALTALVGGLVMAAGFLVVNLLLGGTVDLKFIAFAVNFSIKTGFGLTLVLVLVYLVSTRGFQLLRQPSAR